MFDLIAGGWIERVGEEGVQHTRDDTEEGCEVGGMEEVEMERWEDRDIWEESWRRKGEREMGEREEQSKKVSEGERWGER